MISTHKPTNTMAKKPKDEPTPKTAADLSPEERQLHYPETTETRSLKVNISLDERNGYASELAKTVQETARVEDEKKASASHFKGVLDELGARQRRISQIISDGHEFRPVKCQWSFECAGVTADGDRIFHPEKKALVRLDTYEVVTVETMTEQDRQPLLGAVLDVKPSEAAEAEGEITEREGEGDE